MERNIWSEINEFACGIDNAMFHKNDITKSDYNKLETYKTELANMRDYSNETSVDDTTMFICDLQVRMRGYGIRG